MILEPNVALVFSPFVTSHHCIHSQISSFLYVPSVCSSLACCFPSSLMFLSHKHSAHTSALLLTLYFRVLSCCARPEPAHSTICDQIDNYFSLAHFSILSPRFCLRSAMIGGLEGDKSSWSVLSFWDGQIREGGGKISEGGFAAPHRSKVLEDPSA